MPISHEENAVDSTAHFIEEFPFVRQFQWMTVFCSIPLCKTSSLMANVFKEVSRHIGMQAVAEEDI